MRTFFRENWLTMVILLLAGVMCILWARVWYQNAEFRSYTTHLETNEDRARCLSYYGWDADPDPVEEYEITLPEEFDEVYTQYNELQKMCGFDMTRYRGKTVIRYTYIINNFPIRFDEPVFANLFVYRDRLIGGDVMTTDLGGFMLPLDPRRQFGK